MCKWSSVIQNKIHPSVLNFVCVCVIEKLSMFTSLFIHSIHIVCKSHAFLYKTFLIYLIISFSVSGEEPMYLIGIPKTHNTFQGNFSQI